MKDAIRQRALELGFDACHLTTVDSPSSAPQFQRWLAAHRHGEMGYLQRNAGKRVDPQQVLPGARTIICVAASYERFNSLVSVVRGQRPVVECGDPTTHNPQPATHNPRPIGIVARYARYRDYHVLLGERLRHLTGFVNRLGEPATRSLWYVDTGPLLERDLAQRAGLGFIGKHTNLISPRLGNWIFLAEIITTLELEPDVPETNRCGTCVRCLAACPTAAITAPFQLDARLCISYLTIELKG